MTTIGDMIGRASLVNYWESFPTKLMKAFERHRDAAEQAYAIYAGYCLPFKPPPRVPGCDTIIRLAWRIECGRTIEDAAGAEYAYRWHLASDRWRGFGAPHLVGM